MFFNVLRLGPNYPAGKSDVHPAPRFNFKKERLDLIKEPRLPSWAETVEHNNKQASVDKSIDEDLIFQQQVSAALEKVKNTVSASPAVVDDPFHVNTTPVSQHTSLSPSTSSSPIQKMEIKKPSRARRFFRGIGRIFGSSEKVKEYDITKEAVVAYPWRTSEE